MLATDRTQQLDQILGTSIAEFDIADDVYTRAVDRYLQLAAWLANYWATSRSAGEVYPQGSFRLGTVVRPIDPRDSYDIDLVCRRDIAKDSTTQQALKSDVGTGISLYVASSPEGTPIRQEGKRCWTLDYPFEPFHIVVLPALPDYLGAKNGILLTDRELREWQRSNPIDYASWFFRVMQREYVQLREGLAKQMDVADVPEWKVKTTLQRSVQALKRHRDRFFADTPDDRPASIIVTTLAARSYRGAGPLFEVLVDVTAKMPALIERRDPKTKTWVQVASPAQGCIESMSARSAGDVWAVGTSVSSVQRWNGKVWRLVKYPRSGGDTSRCKTCHLRGLPRRRTPTRARVCRVRAVRCWRAILFPACPRRRPCAGSRRERSTFALRQS